MGGFSLAGVRYNVVETVSALADMPIAKPKAYASIAKTDAEKRAVLFIAFSFSFHHSSARGS
jgi:hypothetical protein